MRVLSLFAGIGGFDLGLERAGHCVVGQVEIDPFCRRVLERRWPGVERAADVRGVGSWVVGRASRESAGAPWSDVGKHADLLTGGFPCQDLSIAGKRGGLRGQRSGLFWEIIRIAHAITPQWGLFENVPGLVSSHRGRDMETVCAGLRECWPAVGYRVLDSQHFGVPQRRRRVFLVGGPDAARVGEVLALFEGGNGHSSASAAAGAGAAGVLAVGSSSTRLNHDGEYVMTAFDPTAGRDMRAYADGTTPRLKVGTGPQVDLGWAPAIAFTIHSLNASVKMRHAFEDDQSRTLDGMSGPDRNQGGTAIVESNSVRRLTPVECERLQGFPDGWTCLCLPLEAYADDPDDAALRCRCPDGPRYRALGNAVTVPVIEWLGRRIVRA
jgi:DNA (cytosine-5)-methyltransferase 1